MKKIRSIFTLMLIAMFFVGCAGSVVNNTYKTEYVTGAAYNLAGATIKNLNASGKFTPDQLAKIYQGGAIMYNSFQISVDALIAYSKVPDSSVQSIVETSIASLLANWGDLVALVNSVVPGTLSQALQFKGTTAAGAKYTLTVKKLDSGQIQIIIQIGAVVLQYAISEAINIINALNKADVTIDDLTALKAMIKPLNQY
jgi:hypothetical protein